MRYVLTSTHNRAVRVDGLGVIRPGETEISPEVAERFKHQRGLTLVQASLPEGVEVAVVVESEKPRNAKKVK